VERYPSGTEQLHAKLYIVTRIIVLVSVCRKAYTVKQHQVASLLLHRLAANRGLTGVL